jgi:hypothetical protein
MAVLLSVVLLRMFPNDTILEHLTLRLPMVGRHGPYRHPRPVPARSSLRDSGRRNHPCRRNPGGTRSGAEGDSRSEANRVRQHESRSSRHGPRGNPGRRVGVVGPERATDIGLSARVEGTEVRSLGGLVSFCSEALKKSTAREVADAIFAAFVRMQRDRGKVRRCLMESGAPFANGRGPCGTTPPYPRSAVTVTPAVRPRHA